MSDTQMPVTEANETVERELQTYEFACHVLPTVAEGEVEAIFNSLKGHITKAGGLIFDEEPPQRFDLAYEIEKYLEGRNRSFSSAYFGWIRFRLAGSALQTLTEELDSEKTLLRYLLIKLTKVEEEQPFRFHESIAHRKVVTIADEDIPAEAVSAEEETGATDGTTEAADESVDDTLAGSATDGEDIK